MECCISIKLKVNIKIYTDKQTKTNHILICVPTHDGPNRSQVPAIFCMGRQNPLVFWLLTATQPAITFKMKQATQAIITGYQSKV